MATKSTYNQLDLLGGLYERDVREEKLAKLLLAEITNLKYVRAQTNSSDLKDKLKEDCVKVIDHSMVDLAELCKSLLNKNLKYRSFDWEAHAKLHDVSTYDVPEKSLIAGYFENSESRLRGYFFAFKEVLGSNKTKVDKIIKYFRYANNLLS